MCFAQMPEWLVRIEGDPVDLRLLRQWFADGPVQFRERDGQTYLCADALDALDTRDAIRARADATLCWVNGAAKLADSHFRSVRADGCVLRVQGDRTDTFVQPSPAVMRIRPMPVSIGMVGPDGIATHPTPRVLAYAERCAVDPVARQALEILGTGADTWVDLYKVFEVVRGAVPEKRMISYGWTTKQRISAFTGSANHPEVSGRDARHAVMKKAPPGTTMTMGEARAFVYDLLDRWLGESDRPADGQPAARGLAGD